MSPSGRSHSDRDSQLARIDTAAPEADALGTLVPSEWPSPQIGDRVHVPVGSDGVPRWVDAPLSPAS
jgi:hypothetical protein